MIPAFLFLAAVVAAVLFLRSEAGRPRRVGMLWTIGGAAAFAVAGMALVGLPGAFIYEIAAPWVRLLLDEGYTELGDAAWPAAIVFTLTWPWSLVIAYAAAFGPLRRRPRWTRWAAFVLIPYAAAVALALWAHLSIRDGSPRGRPPVAAAAPPIPRAATAIPRT